MRAVRYRTEPESSLELDLAVRARARAPLPVVALDTFRANQDGFDRETAQAEAARCFRCDAIEGCPTVRVVAGRGPTDRSLRDVAPVGAMERMGLVRRARLGRFSSVETSELLKRVLGGPVEPASAASMQVQSEGVPFIVEELARTHREAGTLQQFDGVWRLGRNAARLMPSAVRTLIDRRAARLPGRTKGALGDAAVLGRSFSLRDLRAIRARIGEGEGTPAALLAVPTDGAAEGDDPLADDLAPAVDAGLLLAQTQGAADYTFAHEQVRQFAMSQLSTARRRQVHAAVVDLLLEGGDPEPAALPMVAQHGARQTSRGTRYPRRRVLRNAPGLPFGRSTDLPKVSLTCLVWRHARGPGTSRDRAVMTTHRRGDTPLLVAEPTRRPPVPFRHGPVPRPGRGRGAAGDRTRCRRRRPR